MWYEGRSVSLFKRKRFALLYKSDFEEDWKDK